MGHRSERFRIRGVDAIATKEANIKLKIKERSRRDGRMIEIIKAGSLPFTPDVMSWLSTKLGKRSSRITQQDVQSLLN